MFASNTLFTLLLTRLPKFHRGEGSRHLGFYVTCDFFSLSRFCEDDVIILPLVGGFFMNDVNAFLENSCNSKFRLGEFHSSTAGSHKVQINKRNMCKSTDYYEEIYM